jgi:hypothetical protein
VVAKAPAPAPVEQDHPVLALESAADGAWNAAAALELTAEQLASLSALAARATVKAGGVYATHFGDADPLRVARGQVPPANGPALSGAWLNATASASLAGTALTAWVGQRYLADLPTQGADIKAAITAIPIKLNSPADPRIKTLAQDLSRFAREVRDNYTASITKPLFVQRVVDAAKQAAAIWTTVQLHLTSARAELDRLAKAPRFGEVQLEKTLVQLRELQGQRRVQDAALRILAGLERLRLALGDDGAPGGANAMQAACERVVAGLAEDRELMQRLRACEEIAQGSAYVGKGEFAANRAAAKALFTKIENEPSELALKQLTDVAAERAEGFLDGQAARWALLLRIDEQGQVSELRHSTRPSA